MENKNSLIEEVASTTESFSWKIIDLNTAEKTCDDSFFERNESGIPKKIASFFNLENVSKGFSKEIKIEFKNKIYIGRLDKDNNNKGDGRLKIHWRVDLKKELSKYQIGDRALFKRLDSDTYSIEIITEKESEKLKIRKIFNSIYCFISSKGFYFSKELINNFYLSLKSKPFVILAGTSGTGKTRLVKLFAEAIGAEYKLVPVRPDWSDSSDLFGHTDLNGNFKPGAILDFISAAQTNKDKPYILCLDEMNLARVEYYLSDILSVIETRDWNNGEIISAPLFNAIDKYPDIIFPENLYLVGTVNMDETTFPFSKKVLDRANTIEFNYVDLIPDFTSISDDTEPMEMPNSFLRTEYLNIKDCISESDYVTEICTEIQDLNTILQKANAHVGYRVRDEIVFYMLNNHKNNLLDESIAFDNEIMQKILPRIQGNSSSVSDILCDLFKFCSGKTHSFRTSDEMIKEMTDLESLKYRNSANKIFMMMKRYEDDGFTSFWL